MHRPPGATHYVPIDWDAAIARIGADARHAGVAAPRRVLHVGAHEQRGRVRVPADGAGARHQQPAGLLEHVPRVERRGARAGDRHRQGHGDARRHPRRRADPRRRPEPGHQPPPDAVGAWSGPSATARPSSRSTRCRRPGCWRFRNPQRVSGVLGRGTALADLHLPIMVGADLALFQLLNRRLVHDDGAARPGVRRCLLRRLRRAERPPRRARSRRAVGGHRPRRRRGRRAVPSGRRPGADHHLLGDGPHPAPPGGRHHPRARQHAAAARRHRQAGRRRLPGARPLQRAGRSHDGHLREAAGGVPRRARGASSASRRRASPASTPSTRIGAMHRGEVDVFVGLGGNFVAAAPDTDVAAAAHGAVRAHGAGVDQAQPLARAMRRRGDHPAVPRTHRARRRRRGGSGSSRSRTR